MLPTDRIVYFAITERFRAARVSVWVIVNVEEWDPHSPCRARCSRRRQAVALS